jgi:hypothetical protein
MKPITQMAFLKATVSLLIGASVLATVSSTALANPNSGSVTSYSNGYISGVNGTNDMVDWSPPTSTNSDSWTGTPGALTANSSLIGSTSDITQVYGPISYSLSDSISASWSSSGNSGTIRIDDSFDVEHPIGLGLMSGTNFSGTVWSYTFTAEATGEVDFNYQGSASQDITGLDYFDLSGPFSQSSFNIYPDSTETEVTGSVIAGQQYTLEVQDSLRFVQSGGISGPNESITDFSFTLPSAPSDVPDSSATLTLLSGALAGLAALRRRFAK